MKPGHGVIDPPIHEDAFFLAFNLLDYDGDLWVDGKKVVTKRSKSGNFTIYDHRRTWLADMKSSFDGLGFHIPRTALAAYEEDLGGKHVDTLHAAPGKDIEDDVVRGLVRACIPVLTDRCNATKMFQDHIAAILTFHLCATYGNTSIRKPVQGVLAPGKRSGHWKCWRLILLRICRWLRLLRHAVYPRDTSLGRSGYPLATHLIAG